MLVKYVVCSDLFRKIFCSDFSVCIFDKNDNLLGNIGYNNPEEGGGITDIDAVLQGQEPDVEELIKNEPPVNNPEDGNNSGSDDPNAHEDTTEIPEHIDNQVQQTEVPPVEEPETKDNTIEDPTEADIVEAQQVSLLFEAIGNSLGWNLDEIDDKDKPVTVDELTKYFSDVVEQNSKPEYADERIQALDEYVRNGGKFEDYYRKQQEALTLDNIDLEDETNQKAVLREFMQRSGYSDEQINKKITRYEDSDVLYWMDLHELEKQGEQKSPWSEDDERIVTALMEGFRYHQLFNPKFGEVPNAEIISWIKSLKERLS